MVELTWEIRLVFLFEGALLVWFSAPFIVNRSTRIHELLAGSALALFYALGYRSSCQTEIWT